jgi:hypothetical protein
LATKDTVTVYPERLRRAREVFEAACAQQGSARNAALETGCGTDTELRATVERMIEANDEVHLILDHPLSLQKEKFLLSGGALVPGERIGDYEVVRELGSGGMGSVYLARPFTSDGQELFAIKVIRRGSLEVSGREISRRFQQEQAILKSLQHPNVARLVESGATEDSNPYLVMEYVEGVRVDQYCEVHGLSTKERIALFRQLCAAVQYLHRNLVVHRDLKPSNILVRKDGTVKLVDFGIAKLLQTSDGYLSPLNATIGLMTPDYASPEQICGGPLSTLTDVYSLGVVLYELLTDAKPFSTPDSPLHETIRRICEEEPRKPSAVIARDSEKRKQANDLRGELDNIVIKAIQKEPERRYASVEQFDEDLRRYLDGLPVVAQGDSLRYRAKKFLRRYKAPVAASCAMLLLLIGGIVATSIEAGTARNQKRLAEDHAKEAEQAKILAEHQTQIADTERARAEHAADDAQIQQGNAERRLQELQQLTKGAVQVYSVTHGRLGSADANVVTQNAHDSLAVLQKEIPLGSDFARLFATTTPQSINSDESWHVPFGWDARETTPHEYFVGVDDNIVHHGKSSLFVHSIAKKPSGTVYIAQVFDANQFRGKRVMLTGYLKSQDLHEQIHLSLVAAAQGSQGTSDGVTVSGTTAWQRYQIVIDVPRDANAITIGFYMNGEGSFWADELNFQPVDSRTPLTTPLEPRNLGFR